MRQRSDAPGSPLNDHAGARELPGELGAEVIVGAAGGEVSST